MLRKHLYISKFGPLYCAYHIQKKHTFLKYFSIWLYEKNITSNEFYSDKSAEELC